MLLAAVCSAAYLLVLILDAGSRRAVVVNDLGNLVAPCVAALACVLAARRTTDRLRASWALLAGFAGTWALGQLAWCWYEVVRQEPVPFPGLPDVGYVASVPFVVMALLVHPLAPRFAAGRLRLSTDAVMVSASLLALMWRLVLREVYDPASAQGLAQVLGLAYVVVDVLVMTLLVLVVARARTREHRPFLLGFGGLAAGAVGHVAHGVLAQGSSWVPGNPVSACWGVGFLLLALGAHSERVRAPGTLAERPPQLRSALLPYIPLGMVMVIVLVDQLQGRRPDAVGRGVGVSLFVSVLVRQLLALVENGRLARGLEATVIARTAELQQSSEALQRQAWTDPLTGLPNRALLYGRIEEALRGRVVAVALLDLDGFKSVNDSLGHAAGDQLLTVVGERLMAQLASGCTVARLGGDEFAFLLPDCADEQQGRVMGGRILRTLAEPVTLGSRSLVLTGSLGMVLSEAGDTPELLLRNADVAMYAAKDAGKDRLRMFEASMSDELLARVALEADLRVALMAGQVVPWFQPVVDLVDGRICGVEALARWPRADGMVSPGVFVPLAEQCGLVSVLGRQILRAACSYAASWNRETPLTLSVNLSAVQLASDDLVDQVREALQDSGLPPQQLVLEITETVLMEDVDAVVPRLAALRALGIRIALDDFGTGYSALGYLQRLPVDIVKIDRAFVREVHLGTRESALAAAVMTLAASLDLDVVAEGIELPEQAERLVELGCRLAQGFLYHPPLPPEQLGVALRTQREDPASHTVGNARTWHRHPEM